VCKGLRRGWVMHNGTTVGNGDGWRHAVSKFTYCISPQKLATVSFSLYYWHPDEFSDVRHLITPTAPLSDFYDCSKLYVNQAATEWHPPIHTCKYWHIKHRQKHTYLTFTRDHLHYSSVLTKWCCEIVRCQ